MAHVYLESGDREHRGVAKVLKVELFALYTVLNLYPGCIKAVSIFWVRNGFVINVSVEFYSLVAMFFIQLHIAVQKYWQ
jgi:hypothetical protein